MKYTYKHKNRGINRQNTHGRTGRETKEKETEMTRMKGKREKSKTGQGGG